MSGLRGGVQSDHKYYPNRRTLSVYLSYGTIWKINNMKYIKYSEIQ